MVFDARRAMLKGPDLFSRFRFADKMVHVNATGASGKERILVFERNRTKRALLVRQMAYHHVAQGELAGEPFLITF